jgi:copper chaperone CopZ
MDTLTLEVQTMYGDHHVVEVRRILLELPGVEDVYASSSFRVVEVTYDPDKITPERIKASLEEAGYLGELSMPSETGEAAYGRSNGNSFFRHTMVYENTRQVISFAQKVGYSGRPLWPCPGMGPIKSNKPEEE